MQQCPNCAAILNEGSDDCQHCGSRILGNASEIEASKCIDCHQFSVRPLAQVFDDLIAHRGADPEWGRWLAIPLVQSVREPSLNGGLPLFIGGAGLIGLYFATMNRNVYGVLVCIGACMLAIWMGLSDSKAKSTFYSQRQQVDRAAERINAGLVDLKGKQICLSCGKVQVPEAFTLREYWSKHVGNQEALVRQSDGLLSLDTGSSAAYQFRDHKVSVHIIYKSETPPTIST